MMIRHKPQLLSKQNYNLIYFANVRTAANMSALKDVGNQLFSKELVDDIVLMTPFELNRLLDEARRQGKYENE
jgi:hypothetical protein